MSATHKTGSERYPDLTDDAEVDRTPSRARPPYPPATPDEMDDEVAPADAETPETDPPEEDAAGPGSGRVADIQGEPPADGNAGPT